MVAGVEQPAVVAEHDVRARAASKKGHFETTAGEHQRAAESGVVDQVSINLLRPCLQRLARVRQRWERCRFASLKQLNLVIPARQLAGERQQQHQHEHSGEYSLCARAAYRCEQGLHRRQKRK